MPQTECVHIISHTHWDREWYLSSGYVNAWLVPFFQSLFDMLDKEPGYRFVLDGQTCLVEDWCEQLALQGQDPAPQRLRLAQYVRQRRLLVGPYYLQPDWQLASEEALVRNLLIGRGLARELGAVMPVGWLLDNFGQISQAPQIHRQFGIEGLFVWRGVELPSTAIRSEFTWAAPDGSCVTAIYLLGSYRNAMRLAEFAEVMHDRVQREVAKLAPFASTQHVLLMNGYDQELAPDDILPPLRSGSMDLDGVRVAQSTPEEYLAAIARAHPSLPRLTGALYSGRYIAVFPGTLSSRMYLKTMNDACQRALEHEAEPLAALLWGLGRPYPAASLCQAWKLLLRNHAHDSICGVSVDDVHNDMEVRFATSAAIARDIAETALGTLAANVDTMRYPHALRCGVVVNSSLRPSDGIVTLPAGLAGEGALYDSEGQIVPMQQGADGRRAVFVADVPALGYTTLFAMPPSGGSVPPAGGAPPATLSVNARTHTIENGFIRVSINPDGSLALTDKRSRVTYPALGILEDGGDAGDTYNYSPPERDRVITSEGHPAEIRLEEAGPLRVRATISTTLQVPEALTPDGKSRSSSLRSLPVVTWLTIEAHSPLVKLRTTVDNAAHDHRLRVLFPTGIRCDASHAETQFDVVARSTVPPRCDDDALPGRVQEIMIGAREAGPITTFPQRTFVDLDDGRRGLAILNRGLPEYEILPQENTIALTLLRAVGWIARSHLQTRNGDAGPTIAVPGAQCLRTMTFDYAILAHPGDWQAGQVVAHADRFNRPLLAVETDVHPGALTEAAGWLQLDAPGWLKATAVKQSEDGQALIVRLHNPSATPTCGTLRSSLRIKRASTVSLEEEDGEHIAVQDAHAVPVTAGPKRIVTIRLEIERAATPLLAGGQPKVIREAAGVPPAPLAEGAVELSAVQAGLASEAKRAAELASQWAEARAALQAAPAGPAGAAQPRLQLREATCARAALEARLSATLLQKAALRAQPLDPATQERLCHVEVALREIGDALNRARVRKRALEYIVGCDDH